MAVLMGLHAVWLIAIVMAFCLLGFKDHFAGNIGFMSTTALRLFIAMFTVLFLWFGGLDVSSTMY